jgi:predicted metal-dependent hydrolase
VNTDRHTLIVSGLQIQVVRKTIKNLHLGVYPPAGRVRVAAPLAMSDDAVRRAVIGKLGWIKRQRARFEAQLRQTKREMVRGESHYFLGRRYRLHVIEHAGPAKIVLRNRVLELAVRPEFNAKARERALHQWYRVRLRELIPPLLAKWEPIVGVQTTDWGIKKMKTKWGACSAGSRRIWLNLELAKKPLQCLEYLIVHELVHFIERHHNDRFVSLMDRHLPDWRLRRDELNSAPLAHDDWSY